MKAGPGYRDQHNQINRLRYCIINGKCVVPYQYDCMLLSCHVRVSE